jgi:hypothetical protein
MIQAKYVKRVMGINKVQGKPFKAVELEEKLLTLISMRDIKKWPANKKEDLPVDL